MKNTIKTTLVLLIAVFTFACDSKSGDDHHGNGGGLTLDGENRWKANPETTGGVNNMITLMASFTESENVADYNALSGSLQKEFAMIFELCTMKGESHNQLHNFLIPIKGYIKGLKSSDLEGCKKDFSDMKIHLEEYDKFFE